MKQHELSKYHEIVVWGAGEYFESVYFRLDPRVKISYLCDSDKTKWGRDFTKKHFVCKSPDVIKNGEDVFVIIAVQFSKVAKEIDELLEKIRVPHCHINVLIAEFQSCYEKNEIKRYHQIMDDLPYEEEYSKLKMFLSVSVPVEACNLRCSYCYIGQNGGFEKERPIYHSPEFIRAALSKKRIGGTAIINFCGVGETLLCRELVPILLELLKEGHYISIITNALFTERIKEILEKSGDYSDRVFFKCSFHYRQLKENSFLEQFVNNIEIIKKSRASYTIELVPEDSIIDDIDDIVGFSYKNFGALPHLTIARNEKLKNIPLLTELEKKEYERIWSRFNSRMFEFKLKKTMRIGEFCLAGKNSVMFSLDTGNTRPCPYNEGRSNIYEDLSKFWIGTAVGKSCGAPWCINSHAYLTLGMVKEIKEYSYYEMRDRVTVNGEHWIKPTMAEIFKQRICDNV